MSTIDETKRNIRIDAPWRFPQALEGQRDEVKRKPLSQMNENNILTSLGLQERECVCNGKLDEKKIRGESKIEEVWGSIYTYTELLENNEFRSNSKGTVQWFYGGS